MDRKENLKNKVINLLAIRLCFTDISIDQIEGDNKILDFCDDSLDLLDAIMYLEDEMDINIPSAEKLITIDDLVDAIDKQLTVEIYEE